MSWIVDKASNMIYCKGQKILLEHKNNAKQHDEEE